MRNLGDLTKLKKLFFDNCGLSFNHIKQGVESGEYGACSFSINDKVIEYRHSKITPKKLGQFVTIWKRSSNGNTVPFDYLDTLDFIMILSKAQDKKGLFIFPKSLLVERGVISTSNKKGKCGMRVYPPWDTNLNQQAESTQKWQAPYFFVIKNKELLNFTLISRIMILDR